MSDKSKKPLYGPPQPASTSSTTRSRQCMGSNQWLLEQMRMQQEGAQQSGRPPLAACGRSRYRIPQNFPARRGRNGQLQPELRPVRIPGLHERGLLEQGRARKQVERPSTRSWAKRQDGGQTNWHWNQKGSMNAFGQADHALASPGAARLGQTLKGSSRCLGVQCS